MKKKEIESKVKNALVEVLGVKKEDITSEKLLIDDLGIDSFASLELVFALEDAVAINISEEDAECFSTVGDVNNYIYNTLAENKRVK